MSNLTVSYVSQTPAGTPAGATAAAPATDSPLGFLAALLDQLAGGGQVATDTGTGASIDVAGLLNAALASQTTTTSDASEPTDLVAALTAQLDKLQNGGDAGGQLSDAIDALMGASAALPAGAASSADITALRDRLTALSQSLAATNPALANKLQALNSKLEATAADPDALTIADLIRSLLGKTPAADDTDDADAAKAAAAGPQVQDNLLQVLTSLGLNTPPIESAAPTNVDTVPASASAAVTGSAAVPAPLLRLSTQLTQIASGLADKSPELAKKIEAVATRLVSGDAADLLGKITAAASQADGTALDTLVRNLIEAKPVASPAPAVPQIAAATLPAPIAPKQSKSAVTEVKAAPPEPAPVTADSAPEPASRLTLAAVAHASSDDPAPQPGIDAKAAAIVADAPKADPAAQPAQPQPQAPVAAQQPRALPAAYQPVANPINMGQVAFEMVRQVHQGSSRFTIRLDPPEMGRVDVKLHVDASGAVNARLTVDRAETLDLFQRDRQSLERALTQAGLDASKTNLEFSLRQQNNPFAGMMGGDQRQQQGNNSPRFSLGSDEAASVPAITLYRGTASAGGVNIFA